jgi:hypothetical protein
MPPLKNPRHETFAQMLVEGQKRGWTQGACYSRAGYNAEGSVADTNASRLLRNAQNGIAARVQEIVGRGARKAAVTVESLINQFDQVFDGAIDDKQFGAAGSAATVKAKLTGFLRDKLEVGRPGEFSDCETLEDVADRMMGELGGVQETLAALDELRALVLAKASDQAVIVIEQPPQPRAGAETRLALEMLRPTKRT